MFYNNNSLCFVRRLAEYSAHTGLMEHILSLGSPARMICFMLIALYGIESSDLRNEFASLNEGDRYMPNNISSGDIVTSRHDYGDFLACGLPHVKVYRVPWISLFFKLSRELATSLRMSGGVKPANSYSIPREVGFIQTFIINRL